MCAVPPPSNDAQLSHLPYSQTYAFSSKTSAAIKRDTRNDSETDANKFTNSLRVCEFLVYEQLCNEQLFSEHRLPRSLRTVYEQFHTAFAPAATR